MLRSGFKDSQIDWAIMKLRAMKNALRLVALLLISGLALAQGTYTQIDYPGATRTFVDSVNTAGDLVGYYTDAGGLFHGFLASGGVYSTIDYPGAQDTQLFGINDSGQIAGFSHSPNVGFVYDTQTQAFITVSYPSASVTDPTAINNAGTVTGYMQLSGSYAGFEWNGSTYRKVVPPGATKTYLWGVSSAGEVVGYYFTSNNSHFSFSFANGKYQQLSIPSTQGAEVFGINPSGSTVVGSGRTSSGTNAGFSYQKNNKTLQTLEFPASSGTAAYAINATGEIAGTFTDLAQVPHGFTWTPSEPAGR